LISFVPIARLWAAPPYACDQQTNYLRMKRPRKSSDPTTARLAPHLLRPREGPAHRGERRQAAGAVAARLTGLPTSILGIGSGHGVELATADADNQGTRPSLQAPNEDGDCAVSGGAGEEVVNMRFNNNLLPRIDAMIATTTTSDPTPRRGAGTMI
jgi:hypothetical protein